MSGPAPDPTFIDNGLHRRLTSAVLRLEGIRFDLPKTYADTEVPRLLAIARTQIETAELFIHKAIARLPE